MNKTRMQPQVELLEDRWAPAILLQLDGGGNLTGIFGNATASVILTQTAPDTFNVDEGINDLGTYSVPGNLTVSLGNSAAFAFPALGIDLGGLAYSSSLNITIGNYLLGASVIFGAPGGDIGGDVKITTGSGPDFVDAGAFGGPINVGGSMSIDTGAGSLGGFFGIETVLLAGGSVGGNLTVTNAQFVFDLAPHTVGGNLSIDSRRESAAVTTGISASVAGNAVIRTGAGPDLHQMGIGSTVGGNLVLDAGNGNNTIILDFGGQTVLGNAILVAGSGSDTVTLMDTTIGGTLTINLGNSGNTAATANNMTFDTGTTVLGRSIIYQGGNGRDNLNITALNAPGARFVGNLGNGADSVTLDVTGSVLASLLLDGGNGTDTFTIIGGPITWPTTLRRFP